MKIYHGTIDFQHLMDPRQMALLKEPCEEWKKELKQHCYNQGLDEKWWAYSMECYCYLRNIQDFLADGETPHERWFGERFKGPNNSFWSNGWISPDFSTRSIKTSSIWQNKFYQESFLGMHRLHGVNLDWRYSDCGSGRIGKFGRIRNLSSENQRERSTDIKKVRRIHIPSSRYSKIVRKRLRIPRTDS